jgi:hypothetical protein
MPGEIDPPLIWPQSTKPSRDCTVQITIFQGTVAVETGWLCCVRRNLEGLLARFSQMPLLPLCDYICGRLPDSHITEMAANSMNRAGLRPYKPVNYHDLNLEYHIAALQRRTGGDDLQSIRWHPARPGSGHPSHIAWHGRP